MGGVSEGDDDGLERSPLHRLARKGIKRGGDEPKRPMPSSRKMVQDTVKMLELLCEVDPRLEARASRAIEALTGGDVNDARGADTARFGGGGRVKTVV